MNKIKKYPYLIFCKSVSCVFWHAYCETTSMPTNRSNLSINRTLLIVLGIILACLLTINARSFYSAESFALPKQDQSILDKNASLELIQETGKAAAMNIAEKISYLK